MSNETCVIENSMLYTKKILYVSNPYKMNSEKTVKIKKRKLGPVNTRTRRELFTAIPCNSSLRILYETAICDITYNFGSQWRSVSL